MRELLRLCSFLSATFWLVGGASAVGQYAVDAKWVEEDSELYFLLIALVAAAALLPVEVQRRKFDELMGVKPADEACKKCKSCDCSCDYLEGVVTSPVSAVMTAVAKTLFSSISLYKILLEIMSGPAAIATVAVSATAYVISQIFVFVNKGNKAQDDSASSISSIIRLALLLLKILLVLFAALGSGMSAGMPLFSLLSIACMIQQATLHPLVQYGAEEIQRVATILVLALLPSVLRHAYRYALTAKDMLWSPAERSEPSWLNNLDRYGVVLYAAVTTIWGPMATVLKVSDSALRRLGVDSVPSAVVSIVLTATLVFLPSLVARYFYVLNHPPQRNDALMQSIEMKHGYKKQKTMAKTPFWSKCCGTQDQADVELDTKQVTLLEKSEKETSVKNINKYQQYQSSEEAAIVEDGQSRQSAYQYKEMSI